MRFGDADLKHLFSTDFYSVTMGAVILSRQITFIHLLSGFWNAATHTWRKPQDTLVGVLLTFLLHILGNGMNYQTDCIAYAYQRSAWTL